MGLQKARRVKNTHNQIIDAIVASVQEAFKAQQLREIKVKVADLPESAEGFTEYELNRVKVRLGTQGIRVQTMTVYNTVFHFIKK